jgi:hypothetical protein
MCQPITVKCSEPGCGKRHPVSVPWEECECGYLSREDRDYCTAHGLNAKPQPQSKSQPEPQTQPRRLSIGRTQPLYGISSGSSALDKIEDIVNRADFASDLTRRQCGIIRWVIRKCRRIMEACADFGESL